MSTTTLFGSSNDDILHTAKEGNPNNNDIENSYLLTELESVTSRTVSPNTSVLNTSGNLKQSRRKALKSQAMKEMEVKIRELEKDQKSDFIEYLEILATFYKVVELC
jgi:16S rRNA G527 N7-methylase RsmG